MQIIVSALDDQWAELTSQRSGIDWLRVDDAESFGQFNKADAFFSLKDDKILPGFELLRKPVFINSVVQTLAELHASANIYRINGWATFLKRSVWEIAGNTNENISALFETLNIKLIPVKDEAGFVSARVIAMIINEAFFAVEDNVSTKAEIDTAMKLGTNYPYGPFEWVTIIGTNHVLALLQKLSLRDGRYKPANLLIKEVNK